LLNAKACKSQYAVYAALCTDDTMSPITKWIKYRAFRNVRRDYKHL